MKKYVIILLSLVLVFFSSCSKRPDSTIENEAEVPGPATKSSVLQGKRDPSKEEKNAKIPATGSNLSVQEPLSEEARLSLDSLNLQISASGASCGIAYIGKNVSSSTVAECIEKNGILLESGYDADYPFMKEMTASQCAKGNFSDVFCLIPNDTVISIVIYEIGKSGDRSLLFSSDTCEPLFFSSNCTETNNGNVQITIITDNGTPTEFSPCFDANGSLLVGQGIYVF